MLDVLAHRRTGVLFAMHPHARERTSRGRTGGARPDDAAPRHLEARAIDTAFVDGLAHVDIGVAVAVRTHVARRREAGAQVGLQIVHGDERRGLARRAGLGIVEHVGVGVDQPGQHGRATEVDHLRVGRDLDLRRLAHLDDALALYQERLVGQHPAGDAVEQASGADCDGGGQRTALIAAAVAAEAGWRARPAPWRAGTGLLSGRDGRGADQAERRRPRTPHGTPLRLTARRRAKRPAAARSARVSAAPSATPRTACRRRTG
jgi:hypothetical protein